MTAENYTRMYDRVREVERDHLDWDARRVAGYAYDHTPAAVRRDYLVELLAYDVDGIRRARVREIELEAEELARRAQEEAERAAVREREAPERGREEQERRAHLEANPWLARRNSRLFKAWAITGEGVRWLAREAELDAQEAAETRERLEMGNAAYFQRKMDHLVEKFRSEVEQETVLKLTAELLGAEFALGDGRRVTWGSATITEHTTRVEMLFANVHGNMATIKRHEAAVKLIASAGVSTLGEIAERQVLA